MERESPQFVEGVSCSYCYNYLTEDKVKAAKERCLQMKLAEKRNQKHLGYIHPSHHKVLR